ncbi:sporulation initiation factor Spo0A C-terminal domain-containing protein [Bacillota bacterium Meth-B3]|nr:sporulation initiation factor Spo0A C-terminal domain-containing protein [Christensenellaceae bacterium]MEA5069474.1 sporulation initiation factor Spo0A C-terminal domain-containing protein [Christensenellaceae bacterium]
MRVREYERWVLAMADPDAARDLARALPAGVHATIAHSGADALARVVEAMPEVLVSDLMLPGWDGIELIRRVRATRLFTLPYAFLLVAPGMTRFTPWAEAAGACAMLTKPADAAMLMRATESLTPLQRLPREGVNRQGILRSLWALGFSARMQGTRYLAMAIELASRDVRLNKQLTTVLYSLVAEAHAVPRQRVEHAMRRVIESAWSGGSLEMQYKLFGNTIDAKRGKPTAGEMIACMAELLRTGMEMDP